MKRMMMLFGLMAMALGLLAQTTVMPAGEGTEANPYQIATCQNLYWIAAPGLVDGMSQTQRWLKHYIQTADINLASVVPSINTWHNGTGWSPIGLNENNKFYGKYNGNNKTISGLYINRPDNANQGLFGYIYTQAEISNLGIINVNITGDNSTGGLVGYNKGTVINCHSSGILTNSGSDFGGLGGLVGYNNGTILNSYSSANLQSTVYRVGGLVGYNYRIITNCYSTGNVTGEAYTGGLVGDNNGDMTNCYSTANVTGNSLIGGLVGYFHENTIINSFYNYESVLINGNHIITMGALTNELYTTWFPEKSLNIDNYLSFDGSNYIINNENELKALLAFGYYAYSFKLNNNLDLNNENNFYIPYFVGNFYGEGHTISNITINLPDIRFLGFFGRTKDSYLANLGLLNISVSGCLDVGGLVGFFERSSISNCFSNGSVTGEDLTGGLIGRSYQSPIRICYNSGDVTGGYYTGGLVGSANYSSITNCFNEGNVIGNNKTGGLVGYIENSYVTNCFNKGNVTGYNRTGGLIGDKDNYNYILDCFNKGNVIGASYTGGLVGCNSNYNGYVKNCYNSASVTGTTFTGGLIGNNFGDLPISCFWDIETSEQFTSSGGTGLTTVEMKTQETYTNAGWTFPDPWSINSEINQGYPYLNYEAILPNDDVTIDTPLQKNAVLHSAYPNPFNPSTTISFDLASPEMVKIDIFNIKGQIIKQLVNKAYDKGTHSIIWDGKDSNDKACGSGVYFYKMTAGKTTQSKKMMLIK